MPAPTPVGAHDFRAPLRWRAVTAVPERLRWAVETLAVQPCDRVLEIGCGSGVAASLVCERLVDGRMLAIDRSPTQIERARRRNRAHVVSGRLTLETVELADLDVGNATFDKVFAINVNLFWVGPAKAELAVVRRVLSRDGRFLLVYETPAPERAQHVAERLSAALRSSRFPEPELLTPAPTLVGCMIRPAPDGAQA
jgi:cyclopropane fatty-acyl-phospholipid synthase-like methyltransferase